MDEKKLSDLARLMSCSIFPLVQAIMKDRLNDEWGKAEDLFETHPFPSSWLVEKKRDVILTQESLRAPWANDSCCLLTPETVSFALHIKFKKKAKIQGGKILQWLEKRSNYPDFDDSIRNDLFFGCAIVLLFQLYGDAMKSRASMVKTEIKKNKNERKLYAFSDGVIISKLIAILKLLDKSIEVSTENYKKLDTAKQYKAKSKDNSFQFLLIDEHNNTAVDFEKYEKHLPYRLKARIALRESIAKNLEIFSGWSGMMYDELQANEIHYWTQNKLVKNHPQSHNILIYLRNRLADLSETKVNLDKLKLDKNLRQASKFLSELCALYGVYISPEKIRRQDWR